VPCRVRPDRFLAHLSPRRRPLAPIVFSRCVDPRGQPLAEFGGEARSAPVII
jgi:hypothetical protein